MKFARTAGSLYFLIALIGGFSIMYVGETLMVKGDAAATFQHLIAHQTLFQLGFLGDLLIILIETLLTVMLMRLFSEYNKTAVKVAGLSRIAMAIIMSVNLIFYVVPYIMLHAGLSMEQEDLENWSYLFLEIHGMGVFAWQLFFAVHMVALSFLICKSKIAKWMQGFVFLGGIGYFTDCLYHFFLSENQVWSIVNGILLGCAVIGELGFAVHLIVKGNSKIIK